METKISVMITDPSDQFRDTLRTQLDAESDLEIVAPPPGSPSCGKAPVF